MAPNDLRVETLFLELFTKCPESGLGKHIILGFMQVSSFLEDLIREVPLHNNTGVHNILCNRHYTLHQCLHCYWCCDHMLSVTPQLALFYDPECGPLIVNTYEATISFSAAFRYKRETPKHRIYHFSAYQLKIK